MYEKRNPRELEPYYGQHVQAMTAEGLHEKSDIAAELAFRDQRITALEAERDAVWDELYQTKFALGQEQGENAALRAKLEAHDE